MTVGKHPLPALVLVLFLALLLAWLPSPEPAAERTGPRDLDEVMAIARDLGLHYRSDRRDGRVVMRLLVSEAPLSWERANAFSAVPRKGADRNGVVAVIQDVGGPRTVPCEGIEPWGAFFVYGDPSLVQRLTAAPRARERPPEAEAEKVSGTRQSYQGS